jgi:exodeoxyribonuclease V beta subunit
MSLTTDTPAAGAPDDREFRLLDPLPSGRLAIQASAGTGKTFTLAALATRYIAEAGLAANELLVVTFTRSATAELRARVRERLVGAAHHLAADPPPVTDDELLTHLAAADRELRLDRIERAITDFDAATITTIHGFATQVLGSLGATSGVDADSTLVDDSAELAAACCADVLAAASTVHPAGSLPGHEPLVKATRNAINIADLVLAPELDGDEGSDTDRLLVELVTRSIALMRTRRRQAGSLSFDDILVELRRALDGGGGRATIETLRSRFKVALIDEFQDTDPVQWDIFRTLFGDPAAALAVGETAGEPGALVLVGDPKQAIYAFRGANVHTYLQAVDPASGTERRSLGTNWRSDAAAVHATSVLLEGTTYGDRDITFLPVRAAEANQLRRLRSSGGAPLPAVSLRLALDAKLDRTSRDQISAEAADDAINADLVARLRELLDDARLPDDSQPGGERRVKPSDIAVLVRSAGEADKVQRALLDQGVPAVLARGDSVLESPAAEQWRMLLEALLRPSDPRRAGAFALSWFGGRSPEWLHAADDEQLAQLQEQLHDWAETLGERGPIDFVRRVWTDTRVSARVLAMPGGDRALTDLDHLAELVQTSAPTGRASVAGLLAVLDAPRPIEVDADIDRDLASRRIESEAAAVQIMTVWVAKGLEFPIVCLPTMWRKRANEVIYQDPDTDRRTYDLTRGGPWPDKTTAAQRKRLAADEAAGEQLRLLYVALTRAKHQTLVWWSRCKDAEGSALARVLFARSADGTIDPAAFTAAKVDLPDDADALDAVRPLVDRSEHTIVAAVHGRPARPRTRWVDPDAQAGGPELSLAVAPAVPDRSPHRWSFTAITNRARTEHGDPYDVSGADRGAADEQGPTDGDPADELEVRDALGGPDAGSAADGSSADDDGAGAGDAAASGAAADPTTGLAMLPAGASFGTLVHSVLEEVDFTDPELDARLGEQIDHQLTWRAVDLTPTRLPDETYRSAGLAVPPGVADAETGRTELVRGLRAAIDTPLGPLFGGVRLRDVPRSDRLDEMSFELRLGQDGASGRRATDRQIGRLIQRHVPPSDLFRTEPLHDWAAQLADGVFSVDLAGHLTGSIDVLLRVRDEQGTPRYVIVDYKTNRLTERGAVPSPADYTPERMAVAMTEHHYPLQALLYAVAVHRYLRWRQPGYDPALHLGGAGYLFVRGMTGAQVAHTGDDPHGVFSWRIPPELVTELSDLLDGRRISGLGR